MAAVNFQQNWDSAKATMTIAAKQHREWGKFAQRVLGWGHNQRYGNESDPAHRPIHSTEFTDTLVGDDWWEKISWALTRHFLTIVSRDDIGSKTVVNAEMWSEYFTATDLIILERNCLDDVKLTLAFSTDGAGRKFTTTRREPAMCTRNWTLKNVKALCEQLIEIYNTKKEHHLWTWKNNFNKKKKLWYLR